MRKKLIFFVFLFISFFILESVNAETTFCNYKSSTEGLEVKFEISNGSSKTAQISGNINNKESIKNWDKAFENTSFIGKDYFTKNSKCPDYIVISKSNTGLRLYVSDSSSLSSIESAIKTKFTTLKSGYPKSLPLLGSQEEKEDEEQWENNIASSCMAFTNPTDCNNGYTDNDEDGNPDSDIRFSCIWNINKFSSKGYCNTDKLLYVTCGDAFDIPYQAPTIISFIVNFLKILTPILLIILSIIALLKALGSSNEDEIKKAQKSLIKKIVAAVMVFFVVSIVQFVVMQFADSGETDDISSCLSCFLNGDCDNSLYYKTNVAGTYFCTDANGTKTCK